LRAAKQGGWFERGENMQNCVFFWVIHVGPERWGCGLVWFWCGRLSLGFVVFVLEWDMVGVGMVGAKLVWEREEAAAKKTECRRQNRKKNVGVATGI